MDREAWLEPRPCLRCKQPYIVHSVQEKLRAPSDPPETRYTLFGEQCPGDDQDALYIDPDVWEEN